MAVTAAPPGAPARTQPVAAKRVRPARWRDARLVAGLLVLLLSVLIGARLIGGADRTTPVLVVASDLPAGHVVVASDLQQVRTRLTTASGHYFRADESKLVLGRTLSRALAQGELLPRTAIATSRKPGDLRDVPIVVEGLRLPRVHIGDLVDIYSTTKPAKQDEEPQVSVVAKGAEVVGEPAARDSSVKVRLVVRVDRDDVEALVQATELTDVDVIEHLPVSAR